MIKKEDIKTMGKAQLRQLVRPVSVQYVTPIINETISRQRNVSLDFAKRQKIVFQKEVKIVLDFLGFEYEN
jgi:hypothetical protein